MIDEANLDQLQGEINGLRVVCEALVQSLLSGSFLGHSEQKAAFVTHVRSILGHFGPDQLLG